MPTQSEAAAPKLIWGVAAIKVEIDRVSETPVPKNRVSELIKSGQLGPAVRKFGRRTIGADVNALHLRLKQIFAEAG